jgi:hypothetical protein
MQTLKMIGKLVLLSPYVARWVIVELCNMLNFPAALGCISSGFVGQRFFHLTLTLFDICIWKILKLMYHQAVLSKNC